MENRAFSVNLEKNPKIAIKVIPGHFTASSTHTNHYLDLGSLKSNAMIARDAARELAIPYLSNTIVDTIVCIERTEVIGAYLAQELLEGGARIMNDGGEISVVTPIVNDIGTLNFKSSMVKQIVNKNVVLLSTWVLSGRTLDRVLDCLSYYSAKIAGISTLFLVPDKTPEQNINALFTSLDIENFKLFSPRECEMCKSGQRLDALISSEGYTRI